MSTPTPTPTPSPPITLYTGSTSPATYSWSPFSTKLEARLRLSHLAYSVVQDASPRAGPRGKIPYARIPAESRPHGWGRAQAQGEEEGEGGGKSKEGEAGVKGARGTEGGEMVGDSAVIIRTLVERGWLEDLNGGLGDGRRAEDVLVRALLEERVYFLGAYERWCIPKNYYRTRDEGPLANIPYPIRVVVGWFLRRTLARNYDGQGVARYTDQERRMFSEEGWRAVNDVLVANNKSRSINGSDGGERRRNGNEGEGANGGICWVLGGDRPTEADASLYGMLAAVFIASANPETQETVRRFPALVEYAERIHEKYFPDYKGWA